MRFYIATPRRVWFSLILGHKIVQQIISLLKIIGDWLIALIDSDAYLFITCGEATQVNGW